MHEVTRVLSAIEQGDPHAAEKLLPLVYDELRRLAAEKMAHEKSGQTLQATALVHEAYIRLVDVEKAQHYLSLCHSDVATLYGYRLRAVSVAWSPDGKELAYSGDDNEIRVWSSVARQQTHALVRDINTLATSAWSQRVGTNALTLTGTDSTSPAAITVMSGTHAVDVPILLGSNLIVSSSGSLTLGGNLSDGGLAKGLTLNGGGGNKTRSHVLTWGGKSAASAAQRD